MRSTSGEPIPPRENPGSVQAEEDGDVESKVLRIVVDIYKIVVFLIVTAKSRLWTGIEEGISRREAGMLVALRT